MWAASTRRPGKEVEEDELVVSGVLRFKNRIREEVRDGQLGSAASGRENKRAEMVTCGISRAKPNIHS